MNRYRPTLLNRLRELPLWLLLGCGVFGAFIQPAEAVVINNWPFFLKVEDEQGVPVRYESFARIYEKSEQGGETVTALRPFWVKFEDEAAESTHSFWLPPLVSYYEDPKGDSFQFFSFIQRERTQVGEDGTEARRSMVFPIWFHSESPGNPEGSHTGLFPLAGSVNDFFFFGRVRWFLFPLYASFERGVEKKQYAPWPIVQSQTSSDGLSGGGGVWPLYTHFYREGDDSSAYQKHFFLWPLIFHVKDEMDREQPRIREGVLPFYSRESSSHSKELNVLWPFFGHGYDEEPEYYEETRYFWPLFVQGRGDEDYLNRWAPFYSYSNYGGTEKWWYLWPLVRIRQSEDKGMLVRRSQLLYLLYWNETQWEARSDNARTASKTHVWPLYSGYDNGAGLKQAQILSPLNVFYPNSKSVRALYSPMFALFRYQHDENSNHTVQTALFNMVSEETRGDRTRFSIGPLFEHETAPGEAKTQLLRGLLGISEKNDKKSFQLLWFHFE